MRRARLPVGLLPVLLLALALAASGCGRAGTTPSSPNPTGGTYSGFLKVSGRQIVDENDKVIHLTGFNVSGWLLNENWLNPGFAIFGGAENEQAVRSYIDNLYPGQDMGKRFTDAYRNHFITRDDLAYWKSLGVNHLRLNVSHVLLASGEDGYAHIDQVVKWAAELNLYVTISLITVPGCANTLDYCDVNKQANLWTSIDDFHQLEALWVAIATRYKDDSAVAGYNLINEPNSPTADMLKQAYLRLIADIRAVDTKHIIFLDGNNYAANFDVFADGALAAADDNLVYSFHLYTAGNCGPLSDWNANIRAFIEAPILDKVKDQAVPVWLGEYAGNCTDWINLVHSIMSEKGVDHMSYYSPKCAGGTNQNTKCLSKLVSSDAWKQLLSNTKKGLLTTGWESDPGFTELEHANFAYDQARLDALFP